MQKAIQTCWAQTLQNRLIALVLAMVLIVPFLATPVDSSVKGMAALAFEGLSILLLVTLLWRVRWDLRRERVAAFLRTGANLPVMLFLGLAVFSCLLSPQKAYSVQETLQIGAGALLYFVVAYQFRRSEHLSRLVDTLLFAAIAASLLGFAQYSISADQRATGTFGNDQLLGSFLMILLPILAATAMTEKAVNRQLAAQVATVLTASCLLLAHARSAWLGAAGGLIVLCALGLLAGKKRKLAQRKHEMVLPIMLAVVSVGFFLFVWPEADSILQRVGTFSKISTDVSLTQRKVYYQGAEKMILERPLTGFGIGTYPYYQQLYTHVGLPLSRMSGMRPSLGEQAHNLYLQTAAEMGIPGLLLLLAIPITFLITGTRRALEMDPGIRRSLLMASLASTVAVGIDGMGSPSWHFGQTTMFFWLIIGLGVGCMRSHTKRREGPIEPEMVPMRFTRSAAVMGALGLAALLPSVVYAGGGNKYVMPVRARILPVNANINSPGSQIYTLNVTFSDHSVADVSTLSGTDFQQSGGQGAMMGTNNRTYQSVQNESDVVHITGTYTSGGKTVSATTRLFVKGPPVPVSARILPVNSNINSPGSQTYTLNVTFSDHSVADVSTLSGTDFQQSGGQGAMMGTNNRTYQSVQNESDVVHITGTYTSGGKTVSATTRLFVKGPPVPVSARILPINSTVKAPNSQIYTLNVTFSDHSVVDVATQSGANFQEVGGQGAMMGTNNGTYQSVAHEHDAVHITGTYTSGGKTVSDTTRLFVK